MKTRRGVARGSFHPHDFASGIQNEFWAGFDETPLKCCSPRCCFQLRGQKHLAIVRHWRAWQQVLMDEFFKKHSDLGIWNSEHW
jgi:hypothetical protein